MEAIGLVASLVNIVQGIDSVCKVARENLHSRSSASKEFGLLLGKLNLYRGIIEGIKIQTEIDEGSSGRLSSLNYVGGPLEACGAAIWLIQDRLENLPKYVFVGKIIDKEIARCLKTFDDTLPILQLALDADQRAVTSAVENYVETIASDVEAIREISRHTASDVSEVMQMISIDRERRMEYARNSERATLQQWLCQCDPDVAYRSSIEGLMPDSGFWFISGIFQEWVDDPQSSQQVLWLHGRSGTGKSTLTSLAINSLKTKEQTLPGHPYAYFYCSFTNGKSRSLINVLASYVAQLCDRLPALYELVADVRSRTQGQVLGDSEVGQMVKILNVAGSMSSHIILFLDAPNESEKPDELVDTLLDLLRHNSALRLLLSCTEDIRIALDIDNVLSIPMKSESVQSDLHQYVSWRIQTDRRLRRLKKSLQDRIVLNLVSRSNSCFRWAMCQLLTLVDHARSEAAIENSLGSLSESLEDLYAQSLLSIAPSDVPFVQRALLWLTFALEPMQLSELSEAMIFQEDIHVINPADRLFAEEAQDILRQCRLLVDYNARTGIVQLGHSSVRDFLLSDACRDGPAKAFHLKGQTSLNKLTRLALGYINLDNFSTGYCASSWQFFERKKEFPLGTYAALAWPDYLDYRDFLPPSEDANVQFAVDLEDSILLNAFRKFLGSAHDENLSNGGNFGAWFQFILPHHTELGVRLSTPLYYASRNGMGTFAKMVLAVDGLSTLEVRGGSRLSTPLHAAAAFGCDNVVSLLLSKGADPNERNGFEERGIEWAQLYGYDNIVKMLLDAGAEPVSEEGMKRLEQFVAALSTGKKVVYKIHADAVDLRIRE